MTLPDPESITSNVGQGTCDFLRLPAELREMIYHHVLTSRRIHPRHRFLARRWTPINLLYVCRTIYDEAFFHLYTRGKFVIAVRPEFVFGLATWVEMYDISGGIAIEWFVKSERIRRIIRHIALDIHWPTIEYVVFMGSGRSRNGDFANEMLEQSMAAVGRMLSPLPGLRTIDISWIKTTLHVGGLEGIAPRTYMIPAWLRGLKYIRRRSNGKVLIRMPAQGPISTEQLELDQQDMGHVWNLLKESLEDMAKIRGLLTELATDD